MTNNMYTHEERSIIIKYIIDNNIDGNLQGNALWKRMEHEGVLNRTWQSMRSHFKHTIINMLHLYGISEYHRKMILHGFGRKTRPITSHSSRSVPVKKPIPFSSDSDSDSTVCVAAQAKRRKRDSGSNSSLDLLTCNTNTDTRNATVIDHNQPSTSTSSAQCDIRSYITATDSNKPATSTSKVKDHKTSKKRNDSVVIIDSDDDEPIKTEVMEQQLETNIENAPFSMEEDTQLILFFKRHQCYLADINNNFAYVAFNYDTPTSIRTPKELRTRFVEHIMPKLFTYDCLTYEEMVTYYDRTDIDVPVEFQQLITKTVAEQKKYKQVTAAKVSVDERSNVDKMISTDVDHPNPPDGCAEVGKLAMVDAATEAQPARLCNKMVDAATQVQPATEDKVCNTECQSQANVSTQTQPHFEDKPCSTDVIVQHVEFISDNMLQIFLPDQDGRKPLQDVQNIYQSPKHTNRPKKYRLLNDKRYVDVAVDASVRRIAIDKCEAELARLTDAVKRLEATLCKLRGYEANQKEILVIKNELCTNGSNNTTILSSSAESFGDIDFIDVDNDESQTGNQLELMFDVFQAELDKKHISTQINSSQTGTQQLDMSNGEQEECSAVIEVQPDIEFTTGQAHQPMDVEQTSDESTAVTEVPTDTSACQTEPLNLSTNSHESDSAENVNSDKFYSAASQN